MTFNAARWRHPAPALVVATISLTACETGISDPGGSACLPVVAYDQALRDRAAAELETLHDDAGLVGVILITLSCGRKSTSQPGRLALLDAVRRHTGRYFAQNRLCRSTQLTDFKNRLT